MLINDLFRIFISIESNQVNKLRHVATLAIVYLIDTLDRLRRFYMFFLEKRRFSWLLEELF